jgi:hypothetical protein
MNIRKVCNIAVATMVGAVSLFVSDKFWTTAKPAYFTSQAEARIGRPLTPFSVAGVARRTTRRAVWTGAIAGGAYGYGYGSGYGYPSYGYGYSSDYSYPSYGYGYSSDYSYPSYGYGYSSDYSYPSYGSGYSYGSYSSGYGYPNYGYRYAYPYYRASYGYYRPWGRRWW